MLPDLSDHDLRSNCLLLILDAPDQTDLGDIKHQKKRVIQPSNSCEHHPRGYGRRANNRRSVILSNFQTISLHFFELDDSDDPKGIEHMNSKKWKIQASFTSELNPRHKYTANKVLRSRISMVLVDTEFRTSSSERAACRKFLRSSVSFHSVGIWQSRLR